MDEDRGKAWPLADAVLVDKVMNVVLNDLKYVFGGITNKSLDPRSCTAGVQLQAAQERRKRGYAGFPSNIV